MFLGILHRGAQGEDLKNLIVLSLFFLSIQSVFATKTRHTIKALNEADMCFPANNLRFDLNMKSGEGITYFEFQEMIKKFNTTFDSFIQKKFGKKLIINGEWENDRVNAHATRDDYNNAVINILGGMVRHPEMTRDGLYMIMCHELGHQFGGAPKKFRGRSDKRSWSSAEGQADYFAVTKCLPLLFSDREENKRLLALVDEESYQQARLKCDDEKCVRMVLAGLSVGRVFASLKNSWKMPSIKNSVQNQVSSTNYKHPIPQCRVDTFISGSLCDSNLDVAFDDIDPAVGSCIRTEDGYSQEKGARPLCWYKPAPLYR